MQNNANSRQVLVLLTGTFPGESGDSAFLQHEIEALAEEFDVVQIYSFKQLDGSRVPLPANVHYMGALEAASKAGVGRMLLKGGIAPAVRAWRAESKSGRARGHQLRVIGNILTGQRFASVIEKDLRKDDDVSVYAFWGTDGAMALPFLPRRYKKTMRLHGFDLYEEERGFSPLRASLFTSVDNVVPISEDGRRYLANKYPDVLDEDRLILARLGTQDYGLSPDPALNQPLTVVSCSSVVPVKRVDSILSAVSTLAEDQPVRWIHFGTGDLFDELEQKTKTALSNNPNLTVDLRGQTANPEIMEYYQNNPVHVFVNASDSEGVPVSIMEALSFGIPVVATAVGGTAEIVGADLGTGIALPQRPADAELAAAIKEVAKNRESYDPRSAWERMSNAKDASKRIVELVSLEKPSAL